MSSVKNKFAPNPSYFTLQWHITQKCNWQCRHCYQDGNDFTKDLPLKSLLVIFKQYLQLIKYLGLTGHKHTRLTFTGGEPLLREDFFTLLERIYPYNKYFYLTILSNGSLIDHKTAKRLKFLGVKAIQVSIEGMEKQNDRLRVKGAFQKIEDALKAITGQKIAAVVSLTLNKHNVNEIPSLIRFCEELGVARLGFRRFVPLGRGDQMRKEILSPVELREIYTYIEKRKRDLFRKKSGLFLLRGCEEAVFSRETDYPLASCALLESRVLVVLPNGDVLPCRRLPVKIGNAFKTGLKSIYRDSKRLGELRNLNNISRECKACVSFASCMGGAKCMAYAYFHNEYAPDPQCWELFKKLPNSDYFDKINPAFSKPR